MSELLLTFPELNEDDDVYILPNEDDDNMNDADPEQPTPFPEQLTALRASLLGDYILPDSPPTSIPESATLTDSEMLTLKHYVAWYRSNGTVQAYKLHAKVLSDASGEEILSLYMARKLAVHVTKLTPTKVDICPRSCIAYTGKFKDLTSCPFV